ncbi:hypothetical protein [Paraburkholderia tropica]
MRGLTDGKLIYPFDGCTDPGPPRRQKRPMQQRAMSG